MKHVTLLTVPVFSELCNLGFSLRRRVFVEEQNVPANDEFEGVDLTATHSVAVIDGDICGYLRVVMLPEHVQICRVAVAQHARGAGVASKMMVKAMDDHRSLRDNRFYLTAQSDKVGFYQKFGFAIHGPEFLDCGMPHLAMKNY